MSNIRNFSLQKVTFQGQLDKAGTAMTLIDTSAHFVHCAFINYQLGTDFDSVESLAVLTSNIDWLDVRDLTGSVRVGGVIISTHSNISINHSKFENNSAEIGGDIFADHNSCIFIFNSNLTGSGYKPRSIESLFGSSIFSQESDVSIWKCNFREKRATCGGAIVSCISNLTVNESNLISNSATDHGGALFTYRSGILIHDSNFQHNTAESAAAISTIEGNNTVQATVFAFNEAYLHGGAVEFFNDSSTVISCLFENNVAKSFGGAALFWLSTGRMFGTDMFYHGDGISCDCTQCNDSCYQANCEHCQREFALRDQISFISNSAPTGAALHVIRSNVRSCGLVFFSKNIANVSSNIYFLNSDGHFKGALMISENKGSFFAFNSNISFSGCTSFFNCSSPEDSTANFKESGALTLYQTMLNLQGSSRFEYNVAEIGGAILGIDSEIFVNKKAKVAVINNNATKNGGGIYLSQSELRCLQESVININNNRASNKGGGIHSISSSIKIMVTGSKVTDESGIMIEQYDSAILNLTENSAIYGGGIYMEAYSKITLLKDYVFETTTERNAVNLLGNFARYGGAIYVHDASNSESCFSNPFKVSSPKSECFVNVVSTHTTVTGKTNFSLSNIRFLSNFAKISGSTLFGGLLDRCIVSPFNEVDRTFDLTINNFLTYKGNGLDYFLDISTGHTDQSISSYPVQVCLCSSGEIMCGYKVRAKAQVRKGYIFSVSVVAVDHVYKPVNATIAGYLRSIESSLIHGQLTQISNMCSNTSFRIISPHNTEELDLFASEGPCRNAELSTLKVDIDFLPCECPIGFIPSKEYHIFCSCQCHPQISLYVTDCNETTQSFQKTENVWMSFVNETHHSGYLALHKYCPFDYCIPPNMSKPVNLNTPDGVNRQCALSRRGMLCGACKPGLTLSLGSSKCLECPDYWPALFVSITIFAILAGIGLVVLFLWLNITVAVGTLNGLLFYANIVAANRVVLLPYPEPNFITVFISWLNLELGIDVCYIKGLDTYTKTWLQLAFPIYIIFLVALLIVVSQYSSKLSQIISKRNPVATLATLILISYGKLFHVILLAQPFSFAALTYPDGSKKLLWLPDGTVGYLAGKHIVLFIVALLILVVCIAYSFLLLCWQLILKLPDWKIFKFFKHPSFVLFMEAYHVPYTPKHRYWTGLLLLARAIIYLISAANVSGDPQIQLVSIIFILSCIILLKMFIATKIFKKWLIDSLESFFYFNIIFLASFTSYNLSTGNNQDGIAYTSVVLSIVVTILIIIYHAFKYIPVFRKMRESKFFEKMKRSKAAEPVQSTNPRITDDSIRRYDDIMDLSDHTVVTSSSTYKSYDQSSVSKPTSTVVEVN